MVDLIIPIVFMLAVVLGEACLFSTCVRAGELATSCLISPGMWCCGCFAGGDFCYGLVVTISPDW